MINKIWNDFDVEENIHWIIMIIAILGIVYAIIMREHGYMQDNDNVVNSETEIVDTLNLK